MIHIDVDRLINGEWISSFEFRGEELAAAD
jgi:hypothetical protein